MMKNTIKLSEHFPFTQSFTSPLAKGPLTCKTVNNNLGKTFYPRLIAIYSNFMQAMVLNNHSYIKKSAIPELATELMRRKEHLRSQTIKMKINEPPKKLLPLENYILPETVYRNSNFYVSVVCKVYFGGEFSTTHPYAWLPVQKVISFGKNRRLLYNTSKTLSQNINNLNSKHILQFIVKVQSNQYINMYDLQNSNIYHPEKVKAEYDEDQFQDVMATQMVFRSSSEKFDWVLYDLNGILRNKGKGK